MNSKVVLAFVTGAVVASGIVYVAVRRSPQPVHVAAVSPAPASTSATTRAPTPVAEPVSTPATALKPAVAPASHPATRPPALIARATPPVNDEVPASVRTDRIPEPVPAPQAAEPPIPAPAPAPEPVPPPEPVKETPPPPAPPPNQVTIPAGTLIGIRLAESLSTDKNEKGDTFYATLDQPLVAGGFAIAERGARVEGRVVDSVAGGKNGKAAHLILALTRVHTSDGQKVAIETAEFDQKGNSSGGDNAAKVGGGAVLGAIIGAMAGGGKGAAIGAGAGGAAGGGAVLLTRGRAASLPTESRLSFKLQRAVIITEQGH